MAVQPVFQARPHDVYAAFINGHFAARLKVNSAGNYVSHLFTVPQYRRKGLATALMAYAAVARGKPFKRTPKKNAIATAFGQKLPATVVTDG